MLQYFFFLFQFILFYTIENNSFFLSNIHSSKNNKINFLHINKTSINKTINPDINNSNNKNSSYLKKNLLIGAIKNYVWENISLFFKSFKHSNFENCDCIIFVDNISQKTINKIISYGAIVYPVPKKFKKKKLINYRWKIYEDFLNNNKDKYNVVFTADLRDVFFQKDVFKFYNLNKSFLGIALEDGVLSQKTNRRWIIKAYGQNVYKTIKHERIFCVGTVWGTIKKFSEFSSIMWKKLDSEWSLTHNVIEQAVGNYIIYYEKKFDDCLIKSDNKDGFVMTIGLTKRENIFLDSQNNILNGKREIATVIHQYDRKPDIVAKVIYKYNSINHNAKRRNYIYINIFLISIIIFLIFYNKIKKLRKSYNHKKININLDKFYKIALEPKNSCDIKNMKLIKIRK